MTHVVWESGTLPRSSGASKLVQEIDRVGQASAIVCARPIADHGPQRTNMIGVLFCYRRNSCRQSSRPTINYDSQITPCTPLWMATP